MPIYAMRCTCGHTEDIVRTVARMNEDLPEHCGAKMTRQIVAPMVAAHIAPYQSQITGEMIGSRSAHRAHLKQHGMIEVGNEKQKVNGPIKPPPGLKDAIIKAAHQHLK